MMAERTFAENLTQILGNPYGAEIRKAIHDALRQAYDRESGASSEIATNATVDSLVSALSYALGLTATKTYDAARDRYVYTVYAGGEQGTTGFVPIDDSVTTTDQTWSSAKISAKIGEIWSEFDAIEGALGEL